MKLQEQISRIKSMMMINEETISLPIIVNGTFNGRNEDEMHAFQSTNGVVIGGMVTEVNKKLREVYASGHNPYITKINVTINVKNRTTSWGVTIDESKDGKAYLGLVTVGSCCTNNFKERADGQLNTMLSWNSTPKNHKLITELITTDSGDSNGDITIVDGKYRLKQFFYQYSLDYKPPHKKEEPKKETPTDDTEYEIDPRIKTEPADATRVQTNYKKL